MKQIGDLYIDDSIPDRLDVFFTKLGNHKRYDEILRKNFDRIAVEKSHPLVELHYGFDYLRHCTYVLKSHLELLQQEREKRQHIRKGVLSNLPNKDD